MVHPLRPKPVHYLSLALSLRRMGVPDGKTDQACQWFTQKGQHRSGAVSVHRLVKDQEGSAAAISEEEYSVGRRLS